MQLTDTVSLASMQSALSPRFLASCHRLCTCLKCLNVSQAATNNCATHLTELNNPITQQPCSCANSFFFIFFYCVYNQLLSIRRWLELCYSKHSHSIRHGYRFWAFRIVPVLFSVASCLFRMCVCLWVKMRGLLLFVFVLRSKYVCESVFLYENCCLQSFPLQH